MELLTQLGINNTTLIQFAIFVVTILILRFFIFSDFAQAADERFKRTKGGEDDAAGMVEKTAQIQQQYEMRAREINSEISQIFSNEKSLVHNRSEEILKAARVDAAQFIDDARKSIAGQIGAVELELKSETQAISGMMVKKLLGKSE